ncbi:MAG: hypothetical protein KBF99_13825 [Leptospiraceae bacterium]|nr:hypothetical protein [Leptospiraceae bacterium]
MFDKTLSYTKRLNSISLIILSQPVLSEGKDIFTTRHNSILCAFAALRGKIFFLHSLRTKQAYTATYIKLG